MARLLSTTLFAAAAAALAVPSQAFKSAAQYDFIVVGGGTSGLVIANRLSEDPTTSVAILERGDSVFDNVNVTSVTGYGKAFGTSIDYAFQSTPQVYAGGKVQTLRAGKALGGTSTINGMAYLRAETSQIDVWSKLGNNITWEALLPYYKKAEHFQVPTKAQRALGASYKASVHGFSGPLSVGWPNEMVASDFSSTLNTTYSSMDLPWNGEPNAGYMRGYSVFPKTIDQTKDVREDAARAYYYPIKLRPNLHLYVNASAQRLTWDTSSKKSQPVANGVVYIDAAGNSQQILAKKEIVLSAGALVSPLILEQSGVGNPAILKSHNIDVKIDLPGVGENLQDQTTTDTTYAANQNMTGAGGFVAYFNARDVLGHKIEQVKQEVLSAIPSWADKVVSASNGTANRTAIEQLFKMQHSLIFEDLVVISEVLVNAPSAGSSVVEYWGLMPFSRGSTHIASANALTPATINPNYFQLDWDMKQQVATAKIARRNANTAPLSSILTSETSPGLDVVPMNAAEEVWAKWLKSTYRSNFHYISSAAMMPKEMGGVVGDDHLVHGSANVRVVDASVLPFQVSGHLTATLYALAERAADVIKARYA